MKTNLKPKFVTEEDGTKTSVILKMQDYEDLLEYMEDLEDACDLLKAENEASDFLPYEVFREKFLTEKKT